MLRKSPLLLLLLALLVSPVTAADLPTVAPTEPSAEVLADDSISIDVAVLLLGLEAFPVRALRADATVALTAKSASDEGFGNCYTSCYPAFDSHCSGGEVAAAVVLGPPTACAIVHVYCTDSCSGPTLSCRYLSSIC